MSDWTHKDEWKKPGKGFCVQVSRHEDPLREEPACFDSEGPHRWAVYAYVYPKHPSFGSFKVDGNMWEQPSLPGHSYPSYFKVHRDNEGVICSFQIGFDYHHDGDWRFTQHATREDAYEVFADAGELFDYLSKHTDATNKATGETV
jgi:hypothetical protein